MNSSFLKTTIYKNSSRKLESAFLCAFLLGLFICEMFFVSSYMDEFFSLLSFVSLFILLINNKLDSSKKVLLYSIVIFTLIGLLSSLLWQLNNITATLIDSFITVKNFFSFLFVFYCFENKKTKESVLHFFSPIAKIFIVLAFATALLNLFINVGVSNGSSRYGIKQFTFYFYNYAHQYYYSCFFMISVLICHEKKKSALIYAIIGLITVALTLKGPAIISLMVFLVSYYFLKKHKKINCFFYLLVGILIFVLGTYQIQTYFFDFTSPRMLFYKYGLITANRYFPFGSGYATFGSDMASRYYSPLYYQYGFNTFWGMTPSDGRFLNDVGVPRFFAQNGYVGFAIFVLGISIFIRKNFIKKYYSVITFSMILSISICLAVHWLGSSNLSSSSGMVGLIALGLLLSNKEVKTI